MKKFDILSPDLLQSRNLIEASAGTGKTFSIALIFLRLLLEKKMEIKHILTVTFTNAAAEELKGRIRAFIREALQYTGGINIETDAIKEIVDKMNHREESRSILKKTLLCFDEASIFTIHGFCQRVLTEHSFESGTGFGTELIEDDSPFRREHAADFIRENLYDMPVNLLSVVWSKMGVSTMTDLARGPRSADCIVLPDSEDLTLETALEQLNTLNRKFFNIYQDANMLWAEKGRTELHSLIQASSLNGNAKNAYKENRYIQMDTFFNRPNLALKVKSKTRELLEKFSQIKLQMIHPFFKMIDQLLETHDAILLSISRVKALFFKSAPAVLKNIKEYKSIKSFDDLISGIKDALDGPLAQTLKESLRDHYRAVLIDESQDTDPVQFTIFKSLFDDERTILFFIGDPKQSIYSFRGADIFAYLDVVQSGYVHESRRYSMDKNYRSTSMLVSAINELFRQKPNPFLNNAIAMEMVNSQGTQHTLTESGQESAPLKIWFQLSSDVEEDDLVRGNRVMGKINSPSAVTLFAKQTAAEITRLLDPESQVFIGDKPLEAGDIAVLVKKRKQGKLIKSMLDELGVPAVFSGDHSVFSSREAIELETVLHAISESGNTALLRAAWITSLLGGSLSDLDTTLELEWEEKQLQFRELRDLWLKRGFYPMFRRFISQNHVVRNLLSTFNGERRLTNLFHLSELLNQAANEEEHGISGILKYLSQQKSEENKRNQEHEQRLESDADAVQIVTIHKSKGLEYPVVFCPFLWGKTEVWQSGTVSFHKGAGAETRICTAVDSSVLNPDEKNAASEENRSEALRLMYVATTRAVHRCYVFWGKINQKESSSLAYLLHDNYDTNASSEQLFKDVQKLKRPQIISVERMPKIEARTLSVSDKNPPQYSARQFRGEIPYFWRFTSYSGLIRNASAEIDEQPGMDDDEPSRNDPASNQEEITIFNFPKGAKTGLAWHEILEKIDFREPECTDLVRNELKRYGFTGDSMVDITQKMIQNVLRTPLTDGKKTFTLSDIPMNRRFSEMEFYFKLQRTTPDTLIRVLGDYARGLHFNRVEGFLKGFIDLIFQHDERYYVVDWKSNHLGKNLSFYEFPWSSLKEAEAAATNNHVLKSMKEHYYILQYYVYTTAVHLYLSQRVPDYDYDRHFGGVFYIFTRGADPDHTPSSGVFRDRPEKSLIEELARVLTGVRP